MRTKLIAIAVGGLLSTLTESKPTTGIVRRAPPPNYEYIGCSSDATNILAEYRGTSSSMTLDICAISCRDYLLFGVTEGNVCFCGNAYTTGPFIASDENCAQPCPGNAEQDCGANFYLAIYQPLDLSVKPEVPASVTYTPIGCYTNVIPFAAVVFAAALQMSQSTVQTCQGLCAGYAYYGLQGPSTCVCGDRIVADARIADPGSCNTPCDGDDTQKCGSSDGLFTSLYATPDYQACTKLNTDLRIKNPGFESGVAYWDPTISSTSITWQSVVFSQGNTGRRAARITSRESGARLYLNQNVPVCPGVGYIFSYWARKPPKADLTCTSGVSFSLGDDIILPVDGFGVRQEVYIAYSGSTLMQVALWGECTFTTALESMYFDDVQLRPATIADAALFPGSGPGR